MQASNIQSKPTSSLNSLGGPARFARPAGDLVPDSAGQSGGAFAQALQTAQTAGSSPAVGAALSRTIAAGDTLTGIVQEQAGAMGVKLEGAQAYRLAQQLAKANRIDNPDRIFVGQQLDMRNLSEQIAQAGVAAPTNQVKPVEVANLPAQRPARPQSVAVQSPASADVVARRTLPRFPHVTSNNAVAPNGKLIPAELAATSGAMPNPVLQKTLDRAVAKGFIPPQDRAAVYDKILGLSKEHNFLPDDFARMTLMESDGMNPRASNERCHGIIQFCDGPARGAATAGYAKNPKAILNLSVHSQLDLVDKYFDEVGLKNKGPAGLEDLYLSVLNPASRAESSSTRPLNIPGAQARDLHVGGDTDNPITRQSIRFGLLQNAAARLREMVPSRMRSGTQAAVAYAETQAN
jgi:LysM domain